MVIFLFGEDSYRSQKKLKRIISRYKEKNPSKLAFKRVEAKKEDTDQLKKFLETQAMFTETKLLVWEGFFSLPKEGKQEILEWFDKRNLYSSDQSVVVIYEKGSPDKRKKAFKKLDDKAQVQNFKPLEGKKLRGWIEKKFEKEGLSLNYSALGLLIERFEGDLWSQNQAIEKISSYSLAQGRKEVVPEDVKVCTNKSLKTDIFKTIDAIAAKDREKALKYLKNHLQKGEHELRLLAMFSYQFRNLVRVKSLQKEGVTSWKKIKKKTGLSFFVVKKTSKFAQNFNEVELRRNFLYLYRLDRGIKTGVIQDSARALEGFIVKATEEK